MGGVFSRGKKRASKSDEQSSDENAIDELIDSYLRNRLVNAHLVPDFVERRVYATVLRMALKALSLTLSSSRVMGYSLDLRVSPRAVADACRNGAKRTKHDKSAARAREARSERMIGELVDRFVDNKHIDMFMMPDWLERKLYANVLRMAVGVASDTLRASSVDILGHRLSLNCTALDALARPESTPELSDAEEAELTRLVDEQMKEHNVFLLPNGVERHLYLTSLRTLLLIFKECLATSRLHVMNTTLAVTLVPGDPAPVASASNASHPDDAVDEKYVSNTNAAARAAAAAPS